MKRRHLNLALFILCANLSWITADQVYLLRVTPSPDTINDPKAYEFFAGHDAQGWPVWPHDLTLQPVDFAWT